MKNNFKNIFNSRRVNSFGVAFYFFALTLASCKKFVVVPPPSSQLVTASVFANNATANAAITDIYTQMFENSESFTIALDNGLLSDDLTGYETGTATNALFYRNALVAGTTYFGRWQTAYNYIYQANAVISGLQQYTGTSPAVKQQLTGEAYFIRAFWHFYLTNTYGAVPVALTTNYTVTGKLPNTPRIQVLQKVIADLKVAQGLLNSNYVDGSDTVVTTERVRPNRAVATALLARAYLYLGDYDNHNQSDYTKADSAATAVIGNSTYSLCTNLIGANSVFLANSNEAIWQLYTPLPTSDNTKDGDQFILVGAPSTCSISPQLLAAFEPGDQRKINWISSISEGTSTYYFPFKYKISQSTSPNGDASTVTEYTMVMRMAEQYLIRAEARVKESAPNLLGAIADLNMIRNRAGLPNTTAASQADLLTAILHERQVEMFTEWGARWFDLNRTGTTTAVMSVVTPQKGGTWNPDGHQELYPIALTELERDPNLKQNAGY